MHILKKIIFLTILSILFTSCSQEENLKIQKKYSSYIVNTWSIDSTNQYIWYSRWIEQVMLATKSPWRIKYLEKNIWDSVYVWELLASLDSAEARTGYNTANNIKNSLESLKNSTDIALNEQIKAMEAKIEQIKIGVDWIKLWFEDVKNITENQIITAEVWVKQAKIWLETAQVNLDETKNILNIKKENLIAGSKSAITQSLILNESIIAFSDKLLWVTKENKRNNDKFENYLWKKDSNHFKNTKIIFLETKILFDEYKLYYENNIENNIKISEKIIIEWLKKAEFLAEKEKILLKEIYKVLDNSIENIYFTVQTIMDFQKQTSILWINLENSLLMVEWNFVLWIKWSLQNFDNFDWESKKAISILEKQISLAKAWLETAQKTLEQYKSMSIWEVNNIETKKNISSKQLDEAIAWLKALKAKKEASLREIDAKITEVNGWKNSAWVMINNWKIFAPFSWIITKKLAEKWQVINAGMPIYEIANTKVITIKTNISDTIHNNLNLWDIIENIKIDSLDKLYSWKITSISKSLNQITKKYDIEINIENSKLEIPVWAMVRIKFNNSSTSNNEKEKEQLNLIIPNSAIISKFMIPWVYVLQDKKAIFKNIEIIKMWDTFSEINWLQKWEIIITSWKENIFDGEELK